MKDYKFEFEVDEKKYSLVFNLNVMESIQNNRKHALPLRSWEAVLTSPFAFVNAFISCKLFWIVASNSFVFKSSVK